MYLESRMDNLYGEFQEFRKELRELAEKFKNDNSQGKKHKQTDEACRHLGCSKRWLQMQVKAGRLKKFKVGGKIYYATEDLDQLITNNETE